MSNISNEKQGLIQRRRDEIENFLNERMPVLIEFMEDLGYEKPHLVLLEAKRFIPTLSDYLKKQKVEKEDKNWIVSVVGYFIGEVFTQNYNGAWYLNEDHDSSTFGKFLVGEFFNSNISLDPFEIAYKYISQEENRDLALIIDNIEKKINS